MFQSKGLRLDFTTSFYKSFELLLVKLSQFAKSIFTLDYKTTNQRVIHYSTFASVTH